MVFSLFREILDRMSWMFGGSTGCFALAALLADARSHKNHTWYNIGRSPLSLAQ